jgi:methylenetetrahydrofolate dehydrogenase (NADP+) / methenyltetrahydrofolate cyclohydrolase
MEESANPAQPNPISELPMQLIDGKAIAAKINQESRAAVAELVARGSMPGLAVVLVGEDPASQAYVRSKDKTCRELGMHSVKHELPVSTSQSELLALVRRLNADASVHGILVQSPLPPQIEERAIVEAIDPRKDVDGFHPVNVGKLALGDGDAFVPCTPLGCQRLLIETGIETKGMNVVVLGRSMIVGKPMALLLMGKGPGGDATVTVAHSQTRDLTAVCRGADILIAAIGRPEFVQAAMVKDGAVVIDVGINRIPAPDTPKGSKLVGDVAFAEVAQKCRAITPVPGGVGPMTIAMLMQNTIASCRRWAAR